MTGTAEDHVRKWLKGSGVPLEFRTAEQFRRVAWDVQHARIYRDHSTGELREVDVVADVSPVSFASPRAPHIAVRFVIECKSSTAASWVAFVQGRDRLNIRDTRDQVRDTLEIEFRAGFGPNDIGPLFDAPILASPQPYAYQLTDTGQGNREAYNALRQVMSAVLGLRDDVPTVDNRPGAVFFVPVLVTAAPLFIVSPDGQQEASVRAADRVLVVSRLLPVDRVHSVWVVREEALPAFVDDVRASVDVLGRGYP